VTSVQSPSGNIASAASTAPSAVEAPSQQQASVPAPAEEKPASADPGSLEQQLLAGQPPGTVIKCVTAQVIQTPQGPRIVLQGLQGAEFTPQQLAVVQQQVKQQLLKGVSAKLVPTFADRGCRLVRSLGRYSSLADSDHGV
jgi:nucleosome-remodeling factor subunit BPTF